MRRRARVAYLITSHKLPDQVLRLVSILREHSPGAAIVIHHDDRASKLDRSALEARKVQLLEPPSAVAWGEFSHLTMTMRCLRWTLASTECEWLVLLSGQDYPIRPVAEIEQALGAADVDAFIQAIPCPRPSHLGGAVDEFAARYHYRWRPVSSPPLQRLARALPSVRLRTMPSGIWAGVPSLRSPFGDRLLCHFGSDWFTLSRRAIEVLDRFWRDRPDVVAYYRRTPAPTESFPQTVLANDPAISLSTDSRRFLVFEPGAANPRVLGIADLEAILASGADFARKFDQSADRSVLDELDRRVHGHGA